MKNIFSGLCVLALLSGCATEVPRVSDGKMHCECLVCKKNADLACVDVVVDKDTPRYAYNGKTYYFCSEDCKAVFVKNAEKFMGK